MTKMRRIECKTAVKSKHSQNHACRGRTAIGYSLRRAVERDRKAHALRGPKPKLSEITNLVLGILRKHRHRPGSFGNLLSEPFEIFTRSVPTRGRPS